MRAVPVLQRHRVHQQARFAVAELPEDEALLRAAKEEVLALLDGSGASRLARTGGDTDIGPLMRSGVAGFGLETVIEK